MKWLCLVAALSLPASVACAQEIRIETPEPVASPRSTEPNLGRLYGAGIVGELIGAAVGGLVGAVALVAIGCENGEGWISGYTCLAGWGHGMAGSIALGAAIGSSLSIHHIGDARGRGGNGWATWGASMGGYGLGVVVAAVVIAGADEPTWGVAAGAIVSAIYTPLFGALAYDGTRESAEASPSVSVSTYVAPTARGGGQLGVMGAF